eukprot:COSAG02_NODE_5687_length_4126_cov_2.973429_5_plen_42_part_00
MQGVATISNTMPVDCSLTLRQVCNIEFRCGYIYVTPRSCSS